MSQKFYDILVGASLWYVYYKIEAVKSCGKVPMIVGALTHELKAAQINVQLRLIQELMLYKFQLSHNATESTKYICYVKGENATDQCTVTR